MHNKIIIIAAFGIICLLLVTVILAFYNWNSKIQSTIITGILVGTVTTLVTLIVNLKSSTIERSFITSVVMNESTHLPIFISGITPLEDRLKDLMFMGQPMRQNSSGSSTITLNPPSTFEETIKYTGELVQYTILSSIQRIHLNIEGSTMIFENEHTYVEPNIHRPILPPKKTKYFKTNLETALSQNRFANSDSEDMKWENQPLILPAGTNIQLVNIPSSPTTGPETYKLILSKPQFFEIEFLIRPNAQPGQGAILKGLNLEPELERSSRVYFFTVDAKAVLPAITSENPKRDEYRRWIEWMLLEIENKLS